MNANPEIDTLLQEVLALQSRDGLNHHEKKDLHDKKMLLLDKTYRMVFSENEDSDGELYWKAFEEIVKKYCEKNNHDFVEDTRKRYKLKCKGLEAEKYEEENPDEAEIRKVEIRGALRSIALKYGMDSKDITAALKFNLLNRERVHQFLVSNCGYSDEEWKEFQSTVFDRRYTGSMNAELKDGAVKNTFLIDASNKKAEDEGNEMAYLYDDAIDYVLENSNNYTDKRGKNRQNEAQGYWAIQFVKGDVGKKRAEEKKDYINLEFYSTNKYLYKKYEKKIVFYELNKDNDIDKDIAEKLILLRRRLVKKIHNILMPRMSDELSLRPDTWRKNYTEINKYIWHLFNKWHLVKE
ncbi:hypothetical protein [Selenomonas ruminantium]|uniref:Uncharacterized protein n=1 Tax=Selenomonas ruminantium TaxID=971 RepID=A0A1H0NJX9_SELRU|nr:hypothetical protein [Selenomonas ruminantium]SDO92715.1 hypothetical protein SAMN05216366_10399 [Selenomonas ruminantium]